MDSKIFETHQGGGSHINILKLLVNSQNLISKLFDSLLIKSINVTEKRINYVICSIIFLLEINNLI